MLICWDLVRKFSSVSLSIFATKFVYRPVSTGMFLNLMTTCIRTRKDISSFRFFMAFYSVCCSVLSPYFLLPHTLSESILPENIRIFFQAVIHCIGCIMEPERVIFCPNFSCKVKRVCSRTVSRNSDLAFSSSQDFSELTDALSF